MRRVNYEAFVIAYLRDKGFAAYADVPDGKVQQKPQRFVTVEQTVGHTNGVAVATATLAVQSWAGSQYEAAELAQRAEAAIFEIVNNVNPITHVRRTGLYNYPTSQQEPRYQGTYELTAHLYSKED